MSSIGKQVSDKNVGELIGSIPPKHIYTRMKNVKDGVLITFSNIGGCPKENFKGDDLTQIHCQTSFYTSIGNFLKKNKKNRVVFMGDFFGTGSYYTNVIHNIYTLLLEFNYEGGTHKNLEGTNQVEIVLGAKDINLWRLKYELHKDLVQQDVNMTDIDIVMKKMVTFTNKEGTQDKVYGDYIPYNYRIEKDFKFKYASVYVYSLYQRVVNIITNGGGILPYSLLCNNNLNDLYFISKNEQNIELMTLVLQLGAFILVYPFVPMEKFEHFIYEEEITNAIYYILDKIKDIIDELREVRTDVYVQKMTDIYQRINTIRTDTDTTIYYDEILPLNKWKVVIQNFYDSAKIVHYDEYFHSIFVYDDTLPLFINVYLPYSRYVENDPLKLFTKINPKSGRTWSIKRYYKHLSKIYKKLLSLKLVHQMIDLKNPPLNIIKHTIAEEITTEQGESVHIINSNTNIGSNINNGSMSGGGTKKRWRDRRILYHKTKKNIQKGGLPRTSNSKGAESISTGLDSYIFNTGEVPLGNTKSFNIKKNKYADLNIHFTFRDINRIYREILKYPPTLQSEKELNLFLFLQSFYILIRKNSRKIPMLNGQKVRKHKDLYDILVYKKIHNLFIANIDLGITFPLVVENIYGVNHNFLNISTYTKQKYPTYRGVKKTHDGYSSFQEKTMMLIKNYPLLAINRDGYTEVTSLTSSGNLRLKKTYMGLYPFHTFRNFFLTHEGLPDVDLLEFQNNFIVNPEGNSRNLQAFMVPLFLCDRINGTTKTFYTDDMYFIKLYENENTEITRELFLIIDLKNTVKDKVGKIGTYVGNLSQWMGFFWDRKKIYRREITNIPSVIKDIQTYINYYLPSVSTMRLHLPFTKKEKLLDVNLEADRISMLKKPYKQQRIFQEKDFIDIYKVLKIHSYTKKGYEDPRLAKLRHYFEKLYGKNNLREVNYKLLFKNPSKDDFTNEIKYDESNKVTINTHTLPHTDIKNKLNEGFFKKIFSYNKKHTEESKHRFIIKFPKSIDEKRYYTELASLIFVSFPEDEVQSAQLKNIAKFECINYEIDNIETKPTIYNYLHYLTLKAQYSLAQMLNHNSKYFHNIKKLDNIKIYRLMDDIGKGIKFLHSKNIIHNDIYERNILVYDTDPNISNPVYKITDFGASTINFAELYKKNKPSQKSKKNADDNIQSDYVTIKTNIYGIEESELQLLNIYDTYVPVNKISFKIQPRDYCYYINNFNICGFQTDYWCYGNIFFNVITILYKSLNNPIMVNSTRKKEMYNLLNVSNNPQLDNYYNSLLNENGITSSIPPLSMTQSISPIYTNSDFTDFEEISSNLIDKFNCLKLEVNSITEPNINLKKIKYVFTPETIKFLQRYLCSFEKRQPIETGSDFKTMGTFIEEIKPIKPIEPIEPIEPIKPEFNLGRAPKSRPTPIPNIEPLQTVTRVEIPNLDPDPDPKLGHEIIQTVKFKKPISIDIEYQKQNSLYNTLYCAIINACKKFNIYNDDTSKKIINKLNKKLCDTNIQVTNTYFEEIQNILKEFNIDSNIKETIEQTDLDTNKDIIGIILVEYKFVYNNKHIDYKHTNTKINDCITNFISFFKGELDNDYNKYIVSPTVTDAVKKFYIPKILKKIVDIIKDIFIDNYNDILYDNTKISDTKIEENITINSNIIEMPEWSILIDEINTINTEFKNEITNYVETQFKINKDTINYKFIFYNNVEWTYLDDTSKILHTHDEQVDTLLKTKQWSTHSLLQKINISKSKKIILSRNTTQSIDIGSEKTDADIYNDDATDAPKSFKCKEDLYYTSMTAFNYYDANIKKKLIEDKKASNIKTETARYTQKIKLLIKSIINQ